MSTISATFTLKLRGGALVLDAYITLQDRYKCNDLDTRAQGLGTTAVVGPLLAEHPNRLFHSRFPIPHPVDVFRSVLRCSIQALPYSGAFALTARRFSPRFSPQRSPSPSQVPPRLRFFAWRPCSLRDMTSRSHPPQPPPPPLPPPVREEEGQDEVGDALWCPRVALLAPGDGIGSPPDSGEGK